MLAEVAKSLGKFATPVAPEAILCLDTETTGLAGGTGTLAFMVGLAWLESGALRVVQWILAGFAAEGALVERVRERMALAGVLVTFNGKSFDLPLLKTRARLAGTDLLTDGLAHLDLLHVTRRLLHAGWPDCRLRTAEARALRLERPDDLPGAEAPAAWRRWLERGDTSQLARVADHNRADLLALVALMAVLEKPTAREAPLLTSL
ncbi:MAG TPA: ribonuclease H-like domain-containing protein [Burkholderiales bacterium]|nr:ribonuclease H-like domain-containing protein [Burkholderiales bacterium]